MATDVDDDVLRSLALTPPDEFVAARNQIAKQRKADGDASGSKRVAALRRGSWTDWALNVVADEDAELVQRYVDAATDVRRIQAGADGDLRQALRDLRQFTNDLTAAASKQLAARQHTPDLLELAERLSVVGASDAASARLLGATLAADVEAPDDAEPDDEPFQPKSSGRSRSAARTPQPARKRAEPEPAETKRSAGTRAKRAAEQAADDLRPKRLERAVTEAQETVDAAESALGDADAELADAVAGVDEATAAVERANEALNTARRAQIDAKRRREAARREAVVAARALERAQAAQEKG